MNIHIELIISHLFRWLYTKNHTKLIISHLFRRFYTKNHTKFIISHLFRWFYTKNHIELIIFESISTILYEISYKIYHFAFISMILYEKSYRLTGMQRDEPGLHFEARQQPAGSYIRRIRNEGACARDLLAHSKQSRPEPLPVPAPFAQFLNCLAPRKSIK